ncbi:MAG TPA: dTDP-4-dehydrorhamnose reductase [Chitinophagales bacterium]|nr:dTDP-4-dehydrorhamnose reductase [Chitinophagales bacterium]
MPSILVTGSKGQLGTELTLLAAEYPQYQFTFTDSHGMDITDEKSVRDLFTANRFDYCINCAAYTAVDKAESDMEAAFNLNATAVFHLAQVTREHNVRLIHLSTDFVFDGKKSKPYTEEDQPSPLNIYGKSKWRGEEACLQQNSKSIIIRTSWLYSPFGNNFVKTMQKLGRERKEIGVIYDQVGTPTYAYDLASTIMTMLPRLNENITGIFHYSNEGVCSWYDFAVAIMELSGLSSKVKPLETVEYPTPAKRGHYSVLNKKKIKATFGLTIPYWRDSLKKCIERIEKYNDNEQR